MVSPGPVYIPVLAYDCSFLLRDFVRVSYLLLFLFTGKVSSSLFFVSVLLNRES